MNYQKRYVVFFILDSCIVISAIFISYWLLNPVLIQYTNKMIILSALTLLISHHIAAYFFHLYDRVWSVASASELLTIFYAISISVVTASFLQFIINQDVYFKVMTLTWMLHIIMIGGSRFLLRLLKDKDSFRKTGSLKRILIVGAGQAGTMLVRNLIHNQTNNSIPVAFVDDNPNKKYLKIMNVTVVGTTEDIPKIIENYQIDEIIIAIPSLPKMEIQNIYDRCVSTKVKVKIMPKIEDVMTGKISVNDMKEVNIEDLLGRDEVKLDIVAISNKISGKTILVTGAGGSIGSEICRQVINFTPKKLILLGHGENSIYNIYMELNEKFLECTKIVPVIADIQDRERIFEIIKKHKPEVIYHAAAHKHVPLMEYNPGEAIKNNIFGTKNVADAAHIYGVENFVMISTDKAVNPPNVMGATKRIAEMIVQNLAQHSNTNFAAVRFGNVLGSRGSVVPRFKAQIAAGGPVTVTHPYMTRYFMTIPEASRLVIQAGALAKGGEVFVLDMGEPVKIVNLARNLIHLSGYKEEDIGIEYTGIRPGEKMYEELLNPEEIQEEHIYPNIHVGKANCMSSEQLRALLSELQESDIDSIRTKIIDIANGKWSETINIKSEVSVLK